MRPSASTTTTSTRPGAPGSASIPGDAKFNAAFLYRLGRISARHPFRVVGLWLVAAVAVVALQGIVGGQFENSERVPGVESQHAAQEDVA